MHNKHREALLEQYEEATMMLLMDEYAEADGARLLQKFEEAEENGLVQEVPEDLDKKCRKLINDSFAKQERERRATNFVKGFVKAAVYAFVFLGLMTTMVLSVDALRIPVLNFFLEQRERYTAITYGEDHHSTEVQVERIYQNIAHLLPEDYELVLQSTDSYGSGLLCFKDNSEHVITIQISPAEGNFFIDTEDASQEEITINNHQAFFINKDGYRVIWINAETNTMYDVYTDNLDLDIFWKLVYKIAS